MLRSTNVSRIARLFDPAARQAPLDAEKVGLHPAVDAPLGSVHLGRFSQGGLADDDRERLSRGLAAGARARNSFAR